MPIAGTRGGADDDEHRDAQRGGILGCLNLARVPWSFTMSVRVVVEDAVRAEFVCVDRLRVEDRDGDAIRQFC